MTGTSLQFALREVHRVFTEPRALATIGVLALILGISGPFQTYDYLPLGPRLAYWLAIAASTSVTGVFFGTWSMQAVRRRLPVFAVLILAAGFGAGIPVAGVVTAVSWLAFGSDVGGLFVEMAVYCVVIASGVSLIFGLMKFHAPSATAAADMPEAEKRPRLLERLPVGARGDLVSLSVSDHYVEVVTTRGKALVLMRLSDAIAETEGVDGLQIHRSHWVARDQVANTHRAGGKVSVETSVGTRLPVSRGFLPTAREAGLIS